GDALDARHTQRGLQIFAAAHARADAGKTYGVTRSDRFRRCPQRLRLEQSEFRCGPCGNSTGSNAHELTTSEEWVHEDSPPIGISHLALGMWPCGPSAKC